MASRGGEIGSLLILSATGDGDSGALGGRCAPAFGTVKCVSDLILKIPNNELGSSASEHHFRGVKVRCDASGSSFHAECATNATHPRCRLLLKWPAW